MVHFQKLTGSHDQTSRDLQKADSLIMSLIQSPNVKPVSEEFAIFLEAGRGWGGGEDSFVTVSSLGEANI